MAFPPLIPPPSSAPLQRGWRHLAQAARIAGEGVLETLYPTRCAVCDEPGTLLCRSCSAKLTFIDAWKACQRCGAAWGYLECTECNPVSLATFGIEELPFASCHTALLYDAATKLIVTAYKDQGEQRLAAVMADMMAPLLSPETLGRIDAVTFIPATANALRNRGFDHGLLLATHVGAKIERPVMQAMERPRTSDQRALGTRERIANMQGVFRVASKDLAGRTVLVIDDVMTTGATLINASTALRNAGVEEVHALTFAHA